MHMPKKVLHARASSRPPQRAPSRAQSRIHGMEDLNTSGNANNLTF